MEVNVQVDRLKYAFTKACEQMIPETEALQICLTQTFWDTVKDKIDHREILNIAVRGEVRTGKSTVVIKIAWEVNKYIHKIGLHPNIHTQMHKWIFSDQTEFLRFISGKERNLCIVIDEFNSMAKTGLNATTEEALFGFYSDVFAGQYIHRITASPDIITDKNANIILDVIGKDEDKEVVRCKLIYRDIVTKQHMTIGYCDIFVGDLIENWQKKVRPIVETHGVQNDSDQKIVNYWKERDFYCRYQVKKYRRMQLLKDEGVRDIRELEFADIILGVLQELEDYAKIQRVEQELVLITADEVRRKNKRIYSILALQEIGQKCRAILNLYNSINKMHKKLLSDRTTPQEAIIIERTIKQTKELLEKRVDEQKKLSTLYRDYMNIE